MSDISLLFLKKKSNSFYFKFNFKKKPSFLNHALSPTELSEKLLKHD